MITVPFPFGLTPCIAGNQSRCARRDQANDEDHPATDSPVSVNVTRDDDAAAWTNVASDDDRLFPIGTDGNKADPGIK